MPNGVDNWCDEAPNQMDNCAYPGKLATELLPDAGWIAGDGYDANSCPWFRTPPKPSADGDGGMGLPVQASGAPKITLLSGYCRLVGSTMSRRVCWTGRRPAGRSCADRRLRRRASEPELFGVKPQVATCTDWHESSPQERQSAVA